MKTLLKIALLLLAGLLVLALLVATLRVGPSPSVEIRTDAKAIGARTAVVVAAAAPGRGLSGLRVEVEQGGKTRVVAQRAHRPLPPWALLGRARGKDEIRVEVGRGAVPDLVEGEAVVRVVAERAGTWLRRPGPRSPSSGCPCASSRRRSRSSRRSTTSRRAAPGVVVYKVGASAARDGVRAGAWFFPGSPLPGGGKEDRLALFGVPWDLADEAQVRLLAEDDAGNAAEVAFVDRFFPKPPPATRSRSTTPSSRRW